MDPRGGQGPCCLGVQPRRVHRFPYLERDNLNDSFYSFDNLTNKTIDSCNSDFDYHISHDPQTLCSSALKSEWCKSIQSTPPGGKSKFISPNHYETLRDEDPGDSDQFLIEFDENVDRTESLSMSLTLNDRTENQRVKEKTDPYPQIGVKVTKGQKNRTDITIKLDLDSVTTVHDVIKELVLRSKELDIGNFTVKIEVDRNKKNKYKIKYVKSEWQ